MRCPGVWGALEMESSVSLLAELRSSADASSGERLAEITHGVTSLFLAHNNDYSDEQVALFDDVLACLIDKIETRALIELGERLARQRRAPPRAIHRLATHDDISVAGPVLAHSKVLAEEALIRIIETKTQAHLHAISRRKRITEPVTDALVDHGQAPVLRSVADNPGARFSSNGLRGLARHARRDEVLAERLMRRPDLPVEIYCQLIVQATEEVRQRLIACARPELHADIEQTLATVSNKLIEDEFKRHDYEAAARRLLLRCPDGKIFEDDVLEILPTHDTEQLIVALTLMTDMPVEIVERTLTDASNDLLLVMCRVLEFSSTTVRGILGLKLGTRPTSDVVSVACEDFGKMSHNTARQMLQLWKRGHIH
jgi:uncharacterized protein (DUF2336 family)